MPTETGEEMNGKQNGLEKLCEKCIERDAGLAIIADTGRRTCFIEVMKDQDKYCRYTNMNEIIQTEKGLRYSCGYVCPWSKMSKRISGYLMLNGGC